MPMEIATPAITALIGGVPSRQDKNPPANAVETTKPASGNA